MRSEEHINAGVDLETQGLMGREGRILDGLSSFLPDLGGHEILRGAFGVFVFVVVESLAGDDFDDRQGFVAENADSKFPSGKELFDEHLRAELKAVLKSGRQLRRVPDDVHANTRTLTRGLDYERKIQPGRLAGADHLPSTGGNPLFVESRLAEDLVESEMTAANPLTGVGHSPLLQDFLDLSVLAEGPVDHVIGEIHPRRKLQGTVPHIDLVDLRPQRAQSAGNRGARSQRHLALRARTTQQHHDFLAFQNPGHASIPMICTSVSRSMPRSRAAAALISSIKVRISSAVAPPSLTMKLPCTSETRALPTVKFLKPSSSINLPAGV